MITLPALYQFRGEPMTVHQIARITGKNASTLYCRLKRGMSIDDAVTTPRMYPPGMKPKTFLYRGERLTARQIAERTGVALRTVYARISGETFLEKDELEDPYDWKSDPIRRRAYTFNGTTMALWQWAKRLGMKEHTLRARLIRYGWTVEDALFTPVRHPAGDRRKERRCA